MDRGGRGRGGRGRRGNRVEDKDVRLSKSLSFALRHGANQMGLHMNPGIKAVYLAAFCLSYNSYHCTSISYCCTINMTCNLQSVLLI